MLSKKKKMVRISRLGKAWRLNRKKGQRASESEEGGVGSKINEPE